MTEVALTDSVLDAVEEGFRYRARAVLLKQLETHHLQFTTFLGKQRPLAQFLPIYSLHFKQIQMCLVGESVVYHFF